MLAELEDVEVKNAVEVMCEDCGEPIDYTIDGDKLCEDCAWKRNGPWQSVFAPEEFMSRR